MNALAVYRKKRNFKATPEPAGTRSQNRKKHGPKEPLFVIQKHAARRLHYDFRLQDGGVLKSWAVPKGPSLDPKDKRLAMQTEDHPLNYAEFEGIIPAGNYGAGTVIVWDYGTYVNLSHHPLTKKKRSLKAGLARGQIMVWLKGKKLQGTYILMRLKNDAAGKTPWLLIKGRDKAADARRNPVVSRPESVFSGLTLEQMRQSSKAKKWT